MGHILSNKGIQIKEVKVKAVRDANPPKNAGVVLSFLGLVTFYATSAEPLPMLARGSGRLSSNIHLTHWNKPWLLLR